MNRLCMLIVSSLLLLLLALPASSVPMNVVFSFDSLSINSPLAAVDVTNIPDPVLGMGTLDLDAGTGFFELPTFETSVDASFGPPDGEDARTTTVGFSQTLTSIDGLGNATSLGTGALTCAATGPFGGIICGGLSTEIGGWPPPDGTAIHDAVTQSFTIFGSNNGTVTTAIYSYQQVIPEPTTGLLVGSALVGLGLRRRGGRRAIGTFRSRNPGPTTLVERGQ